MRGSFVLGILGGIFGILIGFGELFFGALVQSAEKVGFIGSSGAGQQLYTQAGVAILGSIIGIAGGAIGRKIGGAMMIIGSLMALLGEGGFGILPFILLIIGGILALREKPVVEMMPPATAISTQAPEPKQLPPDTNKTEYQILKAIQSGKRKPKDIAKMLSMEEKEVKSLLEGLKVKGYLSKDEKLTSKAIDIMS